jgi:hypothetical protein
MMNKPFLGQKCVQGHQNIKQKYTSNFTQERSSKKFYLELLTENVTLFYHKLNLLIDSRLQQTSILLLRMRHHCPVSFPVNPPWPIHSWRVACLLKLTYTDATWHYTIHSTMQSAFVSSHHITKQKNVFLLNISAWKGLILPAFCILVSPPCLFERETEYVHQTSPSTSSFPPTSIILCYELDASISKTDCNLNRYDLAVYERWIDIDKIYNKFYLYV